MSRRTPRTGAAVGRVDILVISAAMLTAPPPTAEST